MVFHDKFAGLDVGIYRKSRKSIKTGGRQALVARVGADGHNGFVGRYGQCPNSKSLQGVYNAVSPEAGKTL
jgi:hypothetical protein